MKDIDFVKRHYQDVAELYMEQKDAKQNEIPVFNTWLNSVNTVLELGCASGFPIAETIMMKGISYTGVDLSPKQIQLAQQRYPKWSEHFIEAEMLSFLRTVTAGTYDGIISMFTIRHLPRRYHVELFEEIKRVLQPSGYFLVDHPTYTDQGRGTWFNDNPMYWSSFSQQWQQLTLKELGFQHVEEYEDVKVFNEEEERTLFCLYQI